MVILLNMSITMILNHDGSFDYQDSFGEKSGHYQVHGKWFRMRDQNGQTIRYTIQQLNETVLDLLDDNGVRLHFVRVIGEGDQSSYEKYLLG